VYVLIRCYEHSLLRICTCAAVFCHILTSVKLISFQKRSVKLLDYGVSESLIAIFLSLNRLVEWQVCGGLVEKSFKQIQDDRYWILNFFFDKGNRILNLGDLLTHAVD
jgi:hypothetical protein